MALGNIVVGVPLDARTEFTGSFFTLLRPLPLVFGLLGLCAFLLHGAAYAALKSEGALRQRARRTALTLAAAFGGAFVLSAIMVRIYLPEALKSVPAWAFSALVWLSLALVAAAVKKGRDGRALFFSSAAFLGLWGIVGAIQYPVLVRATDPALSLTVANASSSALTLKVMLIVAARRHASRHRLYGLRFPRLQGQGGRGRPGVLDGGRNLRRARGVFIIEKPDCIRAKNPVCCRQVPS